MEQKELRRRLSQKVDTAWNAYVDELLKLPPGDLISQASEIAAASFCCNQLKSGAYPADLLEHLLRFDNPLEVMRDQWLEDQPDHVEDFEHAMWSLREFGPEPEDGPISGGMEMG